MRLAISRSVVFALLLASGVGPAFGQPGATPHEDGPLQPIATHLEGSLDTGDVASRWSQEVPIGDDERVWFRWKTSLSTVDAARWEIRDKTGNLLKSAELSAVPQPGQYSYFDIDFQGISLTNEPRVHVVPRQADGQDLPSSTKVSILKAPTGSTDFTDKGLATPIRPMLETVREKFGVPALGGAIVTRKGVDALDVVGIRKHGNSTEAEASDRWHLGSNTKAMTATLIGILVEKDVVAWDTTVAEAFPKWESSMTAIHDVTLEHLTAHRSGIVDEQSPETDALRDSQRTVTERRREFARLLTHRSHSGIRGRFKYQNSNYILAGAMLENITGESWERLMQRELFEPLGMETAGVGAPGSASGVDQPWGHQDSSGSRVASKDDNPPASGPAGTVHASLRDYAKFIRLHLSGSEGSLSLQPTTLKRLHQAFPIIQVGDIRYGWGWTMGLWDGRRSFGHNGSNTWWFCTVEFYPDQGVGFLAVSNIGGDKYGNGDAAAGEVIRRLKERHFQ